MAKKRKSAATRLDEVDRNMYGTFCTAANSLSQLYSAAMSQQRHSFHAGERHALEKLYQWIIAQEEVGTTVNTRDIVAYLQNEFEYGSEALAMSPIPPQSNFQPTSFSTPVHSGGFGPAAVGQGVRSALLDQQTKNSVFSNALSSPVRHNLQQYHLPQDALPLGIDPRSSGNSYPNLQNPESNPHSANSMDMH